MKMAITKPILCTSKTIMSDRSYLLLFGRRGFGFLLTLLGFLLFASLRLEGGDDIRAVQVILRLPSVFAEGEESREK